MQDLDDFSNDDPLVQKRDDTMHFPQCISSDALWECSDETNLN